MKRRLMRLLNSRFPRLFLTRLALTCRSCGTPIPYRGNRWEQADRAYRHWETFHDTGPASKPHAFDDLQEHGYPEVDDGAHQIDQA